MKATRILCWVGLHHWSIEKNPETRNLDRTCVRCGKCQYLAHRMLDVMHVDLSWSGWRSYQR